VVDHPADQKVPSFNVGPRKVKQRAPKGPLALEFGARVLKISDGTRPLQRPLKKKGEEGESMLRRGREVPQRNFKGREKRIFQLLYLEGTKKREKRFQEKTFWPSTFQRGRGLRSNIQKRWRCGRRFSNCAGTGRGEFTTPGGRRRSSFWGRINAVRAYELKQSSENRVA